MELLIAILLQLGFVYTPDQLATLGPNGQDAQVVHAQHIINGGLYHIDEEGHYHIDEEGGVVVEDDVDPDN